ncbi:MAG: T9SS type A sorting domain-containing protein [Bacteroidetes bacterium]|nr:T9SS type A sorting domain-containing protein [Bacteroidota bacterium]
MKKFYFLGVLLTFLFAGMHQRTQAQNTIVCDSVLQTSTCAGGNVIIPFSVTGTFPFGNIFTAQFSDWLGNFGSPVNMGTTFFTIGGNGIIFGTIPANASFSFFYRIRVISSNPQDTSNTSPNSVIITQIAQLNTIISNPGDSACPGDTITLYALNIATAYSWSTGDTTQSIQVTTSGIYSVTTTDALTCQSTTSDTVVFDPSQCTGVAENNFSDQFSLSANPAHDELNINFGNVYDADVLLSIYNSLGQKVQEEKFRAHPSAQEKIGISDLHAGIYFVVLESEGQRVAKKIIVE